MAKEAHGKIMNTIEMLQHWADSGYKNTYICVDSRFRENIGITVADDSRRNQMSQPVLFILNSSMYYIPTDPLYTKWQQVIESYSFEEAVTMMVNHGFTMICLLNCKPYKSMVDTKEGCHKVCSLDGKVVEITYGMIKSRWIKK